MLGSFQLWHAFVWDADVSEDNTLPFSGRKVHYNSNRSNIFIRKAGICLPQPSRHMPDSMYFVTYVLTRAGYSVRTVLMSLNIIIIIIIISCK